VWGTQLSIRVGRFGVSQDLRQWANAGLMTFFFFFFFFGLEARPSASTPALTER
jgi:Na+/H+ antiporter NhaA